MQPRSSSDSPVEIEVVDRRKSVEKRTKNASLKAPNHYTPHGTSETVNLQGLTPSIDVDHPPFKEAYEKFGRRLQRCQEEIKERLEAFERDIQQIQNKPPKADSFWQGAVTGGFLAYVLSFYTAKMMTLGLSEGLGKQADWAFAPLAGILHATVGEAVGGGVRSTFATYKSPDAQIWSDLISALSDRMMYRVACHSKRYARADAQVDQALANIQTSLDKRLGPDPNRSNIVAAFGAFWRSVVCDELAFFAFAIAYVASGSARPFLRRLDSRPLALGGEFGVVLTCGLAGGLFTAATQNVLRKWIQRSEHVSGNNDVVTRMAKLDLIEAMLHALNGMRRRLQLLASPLLLSSASTPRGKGDKNNLILDQINEEVTKQLEEINRLEANFQASAERLQAQTGCVATATAIGLTANNLFCSPAAQATPWVNRPAKWRRLLAKCVGNTAAVAGYVCYMNWVANSLYPLNTGAPINQTLVPQPGPFPGHAPYPAVTEGEMAAYAMHGGFLISLWCSRSILSATTEMAALSFLPGLGLSLGTNAMRVWNLARATANPTPQTDGAAPADTDQNQVIDEHTGGTADGSSQDRDSSGTVSDDEPPGEIQETKEKEEMGADDPKRQPSEDLIGSSSTIEDSDSTDDGSTDDGSTIEASDQEQVLSNLKASGEMLGHINETLKIIDAETND